MNEPEFLNVKRGDTVLFGEDEVAKFSHFVIEVRDLERLPDFFKPQT